MANTSRRPRVFGRIVAVLGIVMVLAGGLTWVAVVNQLSDEHISVSDDADFLGGDEVNGPFSAYAQAQVINKHALEATDGKTYAELEQDDPLRDVAMQASFLRASLFTSVVAFGVALMAIGVGAAFILIGLALSATTKAVERV